MEIEPALLNITTEQLPPGTNVADGARLDVSAQSVWSPLDRAFFDVRVLNPQAQSNCTKTITQMYKAHENEKKNMYMPRVLSVEKATFTPLVFSTMGGMGKEASRFYKHLAGKVSQKTGQKYAEVISFIRRRLRFELLKTCLISLRGYRGRPSKRTIEISELDLNLMPQSEY